MKTKQQLEEQIIDMYLSNKISSDTKDAKLLFLNLYPSKKGLKFIESMLKKPRELEFMRKVVDREIDLEEKGLEISDMSKEYVKSIFNSLVQKRFLKKVGKEYALTHNSNLDPDSLSDAEALVYVKFREMVFNEMTKN
jgi:hypothetical protein